MSLKRLLRPLKYIALGGGLGVSLGANAALAVLDQWGVGASSTTLACADFALPDCGVGTGPVDSGPDVDLINGLVADSEVVSPRGEGEGHARLSRAGSISTPELKAFGAGTAGGPGTAGIGQGFAFGMEGYTYAGPGTTISLDIELSGIITNPNGRSFTSIDADVYILDPGDFAFGGFGTLNLGGLLGEGIFPLDVVSLFLDNSGIDTASLQLDLEDGDQFYVYATLGASAANGAIADALGTLTMDFSDSSGLVAASVPLPPAAWLFVSAVVGMLGVRRAHR